MDSPSTKTWYVYLLCYPDTEEPFYVGKGTGERIYQHERGLNNPHDGNIAKKEAIRTILAQGKQILKKIVAEFDDEYEAYTCEKALVKHYGSQLTNIKPSGGRLHSTQATKPILEPKSENALDQKVLIKERYEIENLEQLRAVANVLRVRVLNLLTESPLTVTQLAEQMQLTPVPSIHTTTTAATHYIPSQASLSHE